MSHPTDDTMKAIGDAVYESFSEKMPSQTLILGAIRDGVADAIWRIATNATDMPCQDFYDFIAKGTEEGIARAARPKEIYE